MDRAKSYTLEIFQFEELFFLFQERGYRIVGPTIRDGAIVYDELESPSALPIGWSDEQAPGRYRLKEAKRKSYFGYNVGPHSWKKYLFPPKRKLWEAEKRGSLVTLAEEPLPSGKTLFLGARSCEIEAMKIQDKVFIEGRFVDPYYKNERDNAFIIAVNCTQAAATCFCLSMESGPEAAAGYDLSLTEILTDEKHYFVAKIGSDAGEEVLAKISPPPCDGEELAAAKSAIGDAVRQMEGNRGVDTREIKEMLYANLENERWDDVASRCLSCANCTMVCPTCFCSDIEEVTDLTGDHTERWKSWGSCFNSDHSYLHGGAVHSSTKSRYRQWLTHKMGSWIDQFGTSGCVGCGRCIAWCPVGIDLRDELAALRENDDRGDSER